MAVVVGDRVCRTVNLCSRLGNRYSPAEKGTVIGFESNAIVRVKWDANHQPERIHIDNLIHPLVVEEEPF